MKILITGGKGFIARNLAEKLEAAHDVSCRGRAELDLLDSVRVADALEAGRFDAVIHTATYDAAPAHSTKDPAKVLENNLKMFFNLVRCRNHFGRMLYFGSGAEFAREHWVPRMGEEYFDRHVPSDPYGFSKYVMTRHVQESRGNLYNLRLFGVFGKYDDWRTRFLANACCRAVLDEPIVMKQNRVFDNLWVEDLARIVGWFLEHQPRHHVYNVCSGTACEFRELAEKVLAAAGKKLAVVAKTGGLGREYSGDNSLLLRELGADFRFTPIDSAIRALYDWQAQNRRLIDREAL